MVGDQLVGRLEDGAVGVAPPVEPVVEPAGGADLVVGEAGVATHGDVLAPLVLAAAAPGGAEHHHLPFADRQLPAHEQLAAEGQPLAEQAGVAGDGEEDVGGRSGRDRVDELLHVHRGCRCGGAGRSVASWRQCRAAPCADRHDPWWSGVTARSVCTIDGLRLRSWASGRSETGMARRWPRRIGRLARPSTSATRSTTTSATPSAAPRITAPPERADPARARRVRHRQLLRGGDPQGARTTTASTPGPGSRTLDIDLDTQMAGPLRHINYYTTFSIRQEVERVLDGVPGRAASPAGRSPERGRRCPGRLGGPLAGPAPPRLRRPHRGRHPRRDGEDRRHVPRRARAGRGVRLHPRPHRVLGRHRHRAATCGRRRSASVSPEPDRFASTCPPTRRTSRTSAGCARRSPTASRASRWSSRCRRSVDAQHLHGLGHRRRPTRTASRCSARSPARIETEFPHVTYWPSYELCDPAPTSTSRTAATCSTSAVDHVGAAVPRRARGGRVAA